MIGVLGGTFDPIHNGHLALARQVIAALPLQQLQLMPCAIPVHKKLPATAPQDRRRMIELAIEEEPRLVVNHLELDRGGPSYTVDSLMALQRQLGATLVLILGADTFNGFSDWHRPSEILSMCHLVVCARPGVTMDRHLFAEHWSDSLNGLISTESGVIYQLEIAECDCSSSEVRESLMVGKSPETCLNPAVAEYIAGHNLYRSLSV